MRLVGDNLRHLSSRGLRSLLARSTASSYRSGLLGFTCGALMQSATAVTFILVNMAVLVLVAYVPSISTALPRLVL